MDDDKDDSQSISMTADMIKMGRCKTWMGGKNLCLGYKYK